MNDGQQRPSLQKSKAAIFALIGLILIVGSIKIVMNSSLFKASPIRWSDTPSLLFFNLDEPCDCMQELVTKADTQIEDWRMTTKENIQVVRLNIGENLDLEARYKVFRAPALVLLDSQGQIVWRQDYTLIEGNPFKLNELEKALSNLEENQCRVCPP